MLFIDYINDIVIYFFFKMETSMKYRDTFDNYLNEILGEYKIIILCLLDIAIYNVKRP